MNKTDITTLIQFNFWANDRLLAACEGLSQEEFMQPVTPNPGWGSLRGVLVHILDAEFGWRTVLQAQDSDIILEEPDFKDLAALKARWVEEQAAWLDYLNWLRDEDLDQMYGGEVQKCPKVWQTILHVITHGIQHRSEAAWILTGFGHSPGELDFGVYLRDTIEE